MNRAYATLDIKALADKPGQKRTFSGTASTPATDRMGDIVEPKGAQFKLPIPLLWQHDSKQPIGWITRAKATDAGIEIEGEVADVPDAGPLKEALSSAWQYIKSGLVRGLSIGFNPIEHAEIKGTYGLRFTKWEWLELSAVTIPANQEATITAIKSIDTALLAASGHGQGGAPTKSPPPGVTGTQQPPASGGLSFSRTSKGTAMQTIQQLREARTLKSARMGELVEHFKTADHVATEEEKAEFDGLNAEVKTIDQDIRIAEFHATQSAAAKGVNGSSSNAASQSRSGMGFVRKTDPEDSFAGQSFVRMQIAKALRYVEARDGNEISAAEIARKRWGGTHPRLVEHIKAAVAGGGTGSGEWGAELALSDARFTGDFITYLYSKTVFDSLPLRGMPANVHVAGQDGAATGYWVGESKAIPVSKADFSDVELRPLEVDALAVCSKRLLRDSSPSAEMWIRDTIVQASAQRVDATFLSAAAASSGVSPAGILNGVSALAPSGTDAAAIRADFQALVQPFITAKNASGLVQVMTPSLAMAISMMVNALGQAEFPDIMEEGGGTLFKRPVYTGDNVTPGDWIVLKPSDIWKIGDTGVQVSMTDSATIEMTDAPAGASDTPTAMASHAVSLWQTNSVGFKVTRGINYQIRRAGAVTVLSNAEYGGVIS